MVAAKHLLADIIDPGVPAGPLNPSSSATRPPDGRLAALDLLDRVRARPGSSAFIVTNSPKVAQDAIAALPGFMDKMGAQRAGFASTVLGGTNGGVGADPRAFDEAVAFVNDFAPEHQQILSDAPFEHLRQIVNAGEILLGNHTPCTLGNFVLGPNAVLPTNGAAQDRA